MVTARRSSRFTMPRERYREADVPHAGRREIGRGIPRSCLQPVWNDARRSRRSAPAWTGTTGRTSPTLRPNSPERPTPPRKRWTRAGRSRGPGNLSGVAGEGPGAGRIPFGCEGARSRHDNQLFQGRLSRRAGKPRHTHPEKEKPSPPRCSGLRAGRLNWSGGSRCAGWGATWIRITKGQGGSSPESLLAP